MAFDLTDEELQATREMNKTAWESEIDKWSKEYLIERYKDLVEIEKEHKKENGQLREEVTHWKGKYHLENRRYLDLYDKKISTPIINAIEEIQEQFFVSKDKIREKIKELEKEYEEYKDSQEWEIFDETKYAYELLQELLEEGDDLSYITNIKNHPQLKHIEYNPYENKYKMWDGEGNYYSFIFLYSNAL